MTPSTQPLVIYHGGACADGFCAAWLLHMVYPNAEFIPANYGDEPPDVAGRNVFIVDFSYKRAVMQRILSAAQAVTVLDHHKTAEAELAGIVDEFIMRPDLIQNPPGSELPIVHFDMQKSGGRLTWDYLVKRRLLSDLNGMPWIVEYTEDRDLWRHALPNTKEINAALRSYPFEFATWDELAERPIGRMADEGKCAHHRPAGTSSIRMGALRPTDQRSPNAFRWR